MAVPYRAEQEETGGLGRVRTASASTFGAGAGYCAWPLRPLSIVAVHLPGAVNAPNRPGEALMAWRGAVRCGGDAPCLKNAKIWTDTYLSTYLPVG